MQSETELLDLFGSCPYAGLVAEISDFAIFLVDRDGIILSWNRGARAIFGYEAHEMIGQPLAQIFVPEDRDAGVPQAELATAARNERAEDVRWHLKKDGGLIWMNGVTIALCDPAGEVRGFAKVARDDTRRKEIEDNLHRSQERFELVAKATNDTIWDWDLTTDIIWWNDNLSSTFGHAAEPAEGPATWWKERIHPEDRKRIVESVQHTIQHGGRVWSGHYRFERADGSYAEVFDRGYTVHNEAGKAVRMLGTITDVSVQKKIEQEREELLQRLEFERHRLSAIFEHAPAFVAVLRGPHQVFEMANPAYYQLVGHREIIGKPLIEALPELADQGFEALLDGVLRSGIPFEGHEIPAKLQRRPGGPVEERFVDLLYQPLTEADGSISGVFSHGIDITEQVQARRSAEEANRLKDEFLATLSHELRTPLTAILGWTDILKTGKISPEDEKRALDTIERSARSQSQLIEDILDVSRMITGKMHLEVHPVDMTSIIEEAVDTVLPTAQAKEIRVMRVIESGSNLVLGDAMRLHQVVWNLLVNAIKFTPKGGQVQVQLARVESHLEISVQDNGIGIAPEALPHIFDRFRQADSTSTRAHGGLGLGLSIVRHLAEMHGGGVEAHSAGLGQGATFTVTLPSAVVGPVNAPRGSEGALFQETGPTEATSQSVHALEDLPRLDDVHVMVVEDQDDTRAFLAVLLQSYGARVTTASSAAEALNLIQTEPPDVLLSDIGMPGQDGYSLIKQVRALPPENGGQVPAAALTAFAREDDRAKALHSGFQHHISKPISAAVLVSVVAELARIGIAGDVVRD